MLRFCKFLVLGMLAVCSIAEADSPASDTPTIILGESTERVDLSRRLSYFRDPSGEYEIDRIIREWKTIATFNEPEESYNFGFSDSAYWFSTKIVNRGSPNSDWVLEGLYPIIDRMDLYLVRENGDIDRYQAGDAVVFKNRGRKHHNINFHFELEQGESVDAFFRVETSGAVQMPLLIWSNEAFTEADHQERFVFGLYYGLLLCMAIFNLLIYMSIRDSNYLWYVSYIVFYGLLQFTLNGLAFEHLWSESAWWNNRAISFFIAMGMFSILGFSRSSGSRPLSRRCRCCSSLRAVS